MYVWVVEFDWTNQKQTIRHTLSFRLLILLSSYSNTKINIALSVVPSSSKNNYNLSIISPKMEFDDDLLSICESTVSSFTVATLQ